MSFRRKNHDRPRWRTLLPGVVVAALAALLVATAAGAADPPKSPGTAQPVPQAPAAPNKPAGPVAPAAPSGPKCDLARGGHSEHDEWASCVSVDAMLSRAPAVGETAVLTFTVNADVTR